MTGAAAAAPAHSHVLFRAAYPASGNANRAAVSGWGHVQYPSDHGVPQPDSLEFVRPPGSPADRFRPATNVARFTLKPYSAGEVTDTGGYLANRVELYSRIASRETPAADWPDPVGSTRWYSFSIYIPRDFVVGSSANWFDFVQWKGLNSGSPAIAMEIRRNDFYLGGKYGDTNLGSISPGHWTHFTVGVRFSGRAASGWVTLYRDGKRRVDHRPTQTMNWASSGNSYGIDPSYLKMGIYRSTSWTTTAAIDMTPMTEGTSLASVS